MLNVNSTLWGNKHPVCAQVHELGPELLADARSRLIAGLKRYFHAKRLEGLLSAKVGSQDRLELLLGLYVSDGHLG